MLVRKVLDKDDAECGAIRGVDLWFKGCDGAIGCKCTPEGMERSERGDISDEDRSRRRRADRVFVILRGEYLVRRNKNNRRTHVVFNFDKLVNSSAFSPPKTGL